MKVNFCVTSVSVFGHTVLQKHCNEQKRYFFTVAIAVYRSREWKRVTESARSDISIVDERRGRYEFTVIIRVSSRKMHEQISQ